jgi:hypothetical protein
MVIYTLGQAKRDHELGYIATYAIERAAMSRGWVVVLGSGNARGWLCDARTKEPREFKSLDSAVSSLEQIGFQVDMLRK